MALEPPSNRRTGASRPLTGERTVRLVLEYDGTDFSGWQVQPARRTVQGLLEEILTKMLSEQVQVVGAGRTDAGVHANGQAAHFRTTRTIPIDGLLRGMNALLPWDVRVRSAEEVPGSFHARRSAVSKDYRYQIYCGATISPFFYRYCHHLPKPPDVDRMAEAARRMVGLRDFACFRAAGSSVQDTTRRLTRVDIEQNGAHIEIRVSGDGFLRHMVRNIAGTLLEVGCGIHPPEWITDLILSRNRDLAGPTGPAKGLFLVRVHYPEHLRRGRGDLDPEEDAWTMRAQRWRERDRDDEDDTN